MTTCNASRDWLINLMVEEDKCKLLIKLIMRIDVNYLLVRDSQNMCP